jgi:two-component system response regulator PilR (NtrC family)
VRELENLLQRALTLGDDVVPALGLPASTTGCDVSPDPVLPSSHRLPLPEDLPAWLDEQERRILQQALYLHGYNRSAAATRLGISLRQMRYRIARLHISLVPEDTGHLAHGL